MVFYRAAWHSRAELSARRECSHTCLQDRLCYDDFAMPAPLDQRKKPVRVQVHVTSGAGVDIQWSDGHASHYDFVYLREHCPCASCADERARKTARTAEQSPAAPNPLPIFRPRPAARAAAPVGNYAIQITFTDGHSTGIYSFDYLREICPCPDCEKAFRPRRS